MGLLSSRNHFGLESQTTQRSPQTEHHRQSFVPQREVR
jgi:hypothetical protein